MEQIAKAALLVHWFQPPPDVKNPEQIDLQYNPTELSWDKSAQLAEITIPGLDAPLQQFVRGQAERLTLELFFDTTDHGMGKGATSVTTLTDRIYQLVKIEPKRHAPPICTFCLERSVSRQLARRQCRQRRKPRDRRCPGAGGRRGGLGNRRSDRRGRQRRGGHRRRRERQSAAQRLQVHCRKRQAEIHACSVPKAFRCGRP